MKQSDTLNRYKYIKSELEYLVDKHFDFGESFKIELIEQALSSDFTLSLFSLKSDLSEVHDELLSELRHAQKWLNSLHHNFNARSLDQLHDQYGIEQVGVQIDIKQDSSPRLFLDDLNLKSDSKSFLESLLSDTENANTRFIYQTTQIEKDQIEKKIEQIKTIFSDGIENLPEDKSLKNISKKDILLFFKHKYLKLIDDFPLFFFREKGDEKIAIIIHYLQDKILKQSSHDFAKKNSIETLYQFGLQSIARLVNYSWNRLLQIVYPNQFLPWQYGKVKEGYWDIIENRRNAIRWIIEDYFNTKPTMIWTLYRSKQYNRKLFGKLGLSYLFNTHYNSMLKPLEETYPKLNYWEFGIFPDRYWLRKNATEESVKVFKWLLMQENISLDELPLAIKEKRLSRQTFSRYKLNSMFEICYSKNLFKIVNESFPLYFKPWEIGKVKQGYWEKESHQKDAIEWFLRESKLDKNKVVQSLRDNSFSKKIFLKSKLSTFFRTIFNNNPNKVFSYITMPQRRLEFENIRITRLLKKRTKKSQTKTILQYILYGFNYSLQKYYEDEMNKRIKRKIVRRKRIMLNEENKYF